jgi:hypothetical protein
MWVGDTAWNAVMATCTGDFSIDDGQTNRPDMRIVVRPSPNGVSLPGKHEVAF